jgi:peroxiredoxin
MSEVLAIGSQAPDFELGAHDGKTYRLRDVLKRKHVALIFYPGNNTPG